MVCLLLAEWNAHGWTVAIRLFQVQTLSWSPNPRGAALSSSLCDLLVKQVTGALTAVDGAMLSTAVLYLA